MVMIQGLEMVRVMIQTSTSREDVGGRIDIVIAAVRRVCTQRDSA